MSILGRRWSNILFNLSITCEQITPKSHFTSMLYGKSKRIEMENVSSLYLKHHIKKLY